MDSINISHLLIILAIIICEHRVLRNKGEEEMIVNVTAYGTGI